MGRNKIAQGRQNLSTFRATPEEARKLDQCLEKLGIGTRSNFFRCISNQFIGQVQAGELPWPPRFKDQSSRKESPKKNGGSGFTLTPPPTLMAKADGELYAEVGASIGEKRRVIGKEVIEKLGKVILRDRISMSELAAASGVQLPTLRNWFAGKHVPTTKKLQPLCDYLSERWTEADEVELEHYRRLIFGQERGAKL